MIEPASSPCNDCRDLVLLGSTGSIGTQTLDVVRLFPDRFRIRALTAGRNTAALAAQAREFRPEVVVIHDREQEAALREALRGEGIEILTGEEGAEYAARLPGIDLVVASIVGVAGLRPVLAAVEEGRCVALANKETLVVAGEHVERARRKSGATLLPIDSEHSAIFQCLLGEDPASVESLILTASGGPFRTRAADTFDRIAPADALRHPNWDMGAKITIDSATLMNKGLEVIEARWLFEVDASRIQVLVHPQSIIHSMVVFRDGSTKAQLGVPDMKVPIQYALTYPERWPAPHERPDWSALQRLDFEEPDTHRFPCLRLAYEALASGGAAPAVLNAANEEAVALFLMERIQFTDIPRSIAHALEALAGVPGDTVEDLFAADRRARECVQELARVAAD
jgi:1-deoxy-D-xylulose-5-phosphate reductoisomerase